MTYLHKITRYTIVAICAGLLAGAPALAHHSTAAFVENVVIKITGTVKQFRWINPHSSFKLDGKADNGKDGLWTVEMTAANALVRQGWKRNSIKEGDQVTVFVNPLRNAITLDDGSQGGLYVGIILADGSTLGRVDGKAGRISPTGE